MCKDDGQECGCCTNQGVWGGNSEPERRPSRGLEEMSSRHGFVILFSKCASTIKLFRVCSYTPSVHCDPPNQLIAPIKLETRTQNLSRARATHRIPLGDDS